MRRYFNIIRFFGAALLLLFSRVAVHAQTRFACATDEQYRERVKLNPALLQKQKQMDALVETYRTAHAKTSVPDTDLIVIPVVFHIIHNNGPENISKNAILGEMERLNIDYRKRNADTSQVRDIFKPLIADAHIQFKLATVDPWGRCTDGIDRVQSSLTKDAGENVKSLSWWDSRQYLNVWVVYNIYGSPIPGTVTAGYSHFPWDALTSPWADGILIGYNYVGKSYRVLTHEIGHYLGLYHPFQDSCSEDQDLQGDHVHDTPPVAAPSFGWHIGINTCHADNPDLPDQIENYMDYADRSFMFTTEQVWRMRAFARERAQLISSSNMAVVMGSACLSAITAGNAAPSAEVSVYPNPVTENIHITVSAAQRQTGHINIYDITGRSLMRSKETVIEAGDQTLSYTRAELGIGSAGVYLLRITLGGSTYEQKLIVKN